MWIQIDCDIDDVVVEDARSGWKSSVNSVFFGLSGASLTIRRPTDPVQTKNAKTTHCCECNNGRSYRISYVLSVLL